MPKRNLKFFLELLTIFIGVTGAFYLNNWQENRNKEHATEKILLEIKNGLTLDLVDLNENLKGHEFSLKSIEYYILALEGKPVPADSFSMATFMLTRDFISIQNRTGYETLKSRGLELIKDDSLRQKIIRLYDFDYEILEKLEESYGEMQYANTYLKEFTSVFAPHYIYENGRIIGLKQPVNIPKQKRAEIRYYLTRISANRYYILSSYRSIIDKVDKLIQEIEQEIK